MTGGGGGGVVLWCELRYKIFTDLGTGENVITCSWLAFLAHFPWRARWSLHALGGREWRRVVNVKTCIYCRYFSLEVGVVLTKSL